MLSEPNQYHKYHDYVNAFEQWEANGNGDIKTKPRLPIHPIVRWTNTIDIKATKFLTTQINFELYYNRSQHLDPMTKTLLSVGLIYTFKNK